MNGFFARITRQLVFSASVVLAMGCSFPTLHELASEINATLESGPLRLGPGDRIEVRFPRRTEWDHSVTVRADGRASFLFLDEMSVAGLTMESLDRTLTEAYQDRGVMVDADLTINLVEIAPRNAVVMGEVNTPGPVPIEGGRLSFLEAIGRAGGPIKETALLEEAVLVRWVPEEGQQRVWHINAGVDSWQGGTPILLQAHDLIFVPNTGIDDVDIWVDQYIRQMIPIPGFVPIN